jgi:hypothetical protein
MNIFDSRAYKMLATSMILSLSAVTTACGPPPVVGDWESEEEVGGETSELDIVDDGTGEATIWFVIELGGELYKAKDEFDVEWTEDGSDSFELDMECTDSDLYEGDCGAEDFTLECDMKSDGETMSCEGDETFSGLEWEFEKQ